MKFRHLVLGAVAGLLTASPSLAAEFDLKLSHMFPSTHFIQTLVFEPWAKSIEEKSNGRVKIQIFAAGSALGDATRQFDQVRGGVVDIAIGIPAIPRGRHPRTTLIELPFTIKTAEAGTKALMEIYDKHLKADYPGTVMLNLTVTEPSAIHTKTPVADLDQVKGMRLRAPTPSVTAMLNALGATPVGLPPTQIYENVERGVVEGNVMPWGPVGAFKLHEVLKHHLNARIDAVAMYTLMNERRYNSLPPDIKKLFDDSIPYFAENWGKWWKDTDQIAIDAAKKAGNTVRDLPDESRDAWRDKLKEVVDNYIAEQEKTVPGSRETYDAMVAALKKYE
jgi:TRAP-type C4-dicarboxylate transport system substrate-binding protein